MHECETLCKVSQKSYKRRNLGSEEKLFSHQRLANSQNQGSFSIAACLFFFYDCDPSAKMYELFVLPAILNFFQQAVLVLNKGGGGQELGLLTPCSAQSKYRSISLFKPQATPLFSVLLFILVLITDPSFSFYITQTINQTPVGCEYLLLSVSRLRSQTTLFNLPY